MHFDQPRVGLYKLDHKLKWTNQNLKANIHILMLIYWTSKKFNNTHPQELMHMHMKRKLDHLGKLAWNNSCIRDHMVTWNALHMRSVVLTRHGVWANCKSMHKLSIRDHKKNIGQYDLVDILAIGPTLDWPILFWRHTFLCGRKLNFEWSTKDSFMHHGQIFDWEDTLEEYKMMGDMFV